MIAARRETIIHAGVGAMTTPQEPSGLFRGWYVRNGMLHYDNDLMPFVADADLQDQYKKELELQEKIRVKMQEQNTLNAMQCSLADRRAQLWAMWEADNQDYIKALARFMDKGAFHFDRLPLGLRDRVPPLPKEIVAAALEQLPARPDAITDKERTKKAAKLEKDLADLRAELDALHDPKWTTDTVGGQDSRKIFLRHWRETQRTLNRPADWLRFDLEVRNKAIRSCWDKFVGKQCVNLNGQRPYDPSL
jgi:hypothetical protein